VLTGVKFCGGCNPDYDRTELLSVIKARYPDMDFEYAEEGCLYDCVLFICGCDVRCAEHSGYQAGIKDIWIDHRLSEEELDDLFGISAT